MATPQACVEKVTLKFTANFSRLPCEKKNCVSNLWALPVCGFFFKTPVFSHSLKMTVDMSVSLNGCLLFVFMCDPVRD